MIIVLFHVLYFVGKFVYQNYRTKKGKSTNDEAVNAEKQFKISESDYKMRDPEAPQDSEEHSIKFFPPAYVQRYKAVSDVLNNIQYQGKLRKVVDFGCAELDFLPYLKNTVGIEEILCVDIDRSLLDSYKDKGAPLVSEYLHTRTTPLVIEICEGSVTDNDTKLEKTDAVICIELVEHLYPDTLTDLPYNIFGYVKPKLVVITTPNADFNVLFPNFSGFRHYDHKFEWSRQQFQDWAENITLRYPDYMVTFDGICKGPEGTEHLGCCSQMAIFQRISEKDICGVGIEGLFKTVVKHEYPFRVDNRSDEQKILDEATYYIRHLSYQDNDMEEEVPLEKLLHMLRSFHISIDILQSILEEAGWRIENRDIGPVVLVPPHTTFSDLSTVEDPFWTNEYSDGDVDDWNREPGPPINSSRLLHQDSIETWDNQNWDEEPSIVIPQNTSVLEDNTYLFDEENVVLDSVLETTKDAETVERYNRISSTEDLHRMPSIDLDDSFRDNVSSRLNQCVELHNSSFSGKVEGAKNDSFVSTTLEPQDHAMSIVAQKLNRTLDTPAFLSVSHASTSPEPYLLQSVQMDQHLRDNSMCNLSMSNEWSLNNSLDQENMSMNITAETSDNKRKTLSLDNDFDDSSRLHSIYLNTSYKETEDSDSNTSTSTDCFHQDQIKTVQLNRSVSQVKHELQSNSSISVGPSVSVENEPQFTSSPKIETKVNSPGKKRRSLDYKEQRNSNNSSKVIEKSPLAALANSSNVSLGATNNLPLQSNNDINISTASTGNLSPEKQRYNNETCSVYGGNIEINSEELTHYFSEDTLTNSDTSTIASALNDDRHATEEFSNTNSASINQSTINGETLQVNLATMSRNKLPESCLTEEEQTGLATANRIDMQSENSNAENLLGNQKLLIKLEPCVEFVAENSDRKTELESEVRSSHGTKHVNNVNSFEPTCNYSKDSSNLESTLFVSSLGGEDTDDVQNASVLKSEKQLECNTGNRESKCKSISPHTVEVAESTELKSSSPENVETPPNSWTLEVMDSGYPNSSSAQDMTPEYDLSSIAQDHPSDSESPSIAEGPRLGVLEVIEVENGDLANNNRDGEGNNMLAAELNEIEDLQPLIAVLENDLENENDIYVGGNGFPLWLLRILNMANPIDAEIHMRDHRELGFPNEGAGDEAGYANLERDEGFDGSSQENSDAENNEIRDN